jgi:hypothetical protein
VRVTRDGSQPRHLERDHEPRRLERWWMQAAALARRPTGRPVARLVFRPPVVTSLIVAQIPSLAGIYELSAVWPRAADGARGDS